MTDVSKSGSRKLWHGACRWCKSGWVLAYLQAGRCSLQVGPASWAPPGNLNLGEGRQNLKFLPSPNPVPQVPDQRVFALAVHEPGVWAPDLGVTTAANRRPSTVAAVTGSPPASFFSSHHHRASTSLATCTSPRQALPVPYTSSLLILSNPPPRALRFSPGPLPPISPLQRLSLCTTGR